VNRPSAVNPDDVKTQVPNVLNAAAGTDVPAPDNPAPDNPAPDNPAPENPGNRVEEEVGADSVEATAVPDVIHNRPTEQRADF
jgi:hypothetical protein